MEEALGRIGIGWWGGCHQYPIGPFTTAAAPALLSFRYVT
jgi:hypothetical protein